VRNIATRDSLWANSDPGSAALARQGYVEAGVHGGMEEAFELLSREEYIAVISNLVRIQGRIGTETAIRVGLEVLGDAKARTPPLFLPVGR